MRLLCLTPLPRCKHRARSQAHHSQGCTPPTMPLPRPTIQVLCHLTLTCGWLSRYDRGLLLGLMPCALFIRYRLYFALQNSNPGSPTKRSSFEGRFFLFVCMGVVVGGALCALVVFDSSAPMQASCKESSTPQPRLHTTHYAPAPPDNPSVVPPDSHLWLVEPI